MRNLFITLILLSLVSLFSIDYTDQQNGHHIILTTQTFSEAAENVAELFQYQFNLTRSIYYQQDIFDDYSDGLPDCNGIKNFITDEYTDVEDLENSSVLIIGSGLLVWNSTNPKCNFITFSSNENDPANGYIVEDKFVELPGSSDKIPIGRIPAQNMEEFNQYWNKFVTYNLIPNPGWWRNTLLLHADDEWNGQSVETVSGLDHTNLQQIVSENLSPAITHKKVLGIEYPAAENGEKPLATEAMLDAVNEGAFLWYYVGHGYPLGWGHENYLDIERDLPLMQNNDKYPVLFAATVSSSSFGSEEFNCISEQLVLADSKGTIASIGATDVCSGSSNNDLGKFFLENLINDRMPVGKALTQAKLSTNSPSNARKFCILGDPLLYCLPPVPIEGLVISGEPDTLFIGENYEISGNCDLPNLSFRAWESNKELHYENLPYEIDYWKMGEVIYEEDMEVYNGEFSLYLDIPDYINVGDNGSLRAYCYDPVTGEDMVLYNAPKPIAEPYAGGDDPVIEQVSGIALNNYPNPFNPITVISFNLAEDTNYNKAEIAIFNLKGQKIRSQNINMTGAKGKQSYTWNGEDTQGNPVSSGVYLYTLKLDNKLSASKKMMLLK